MPSAIAKVALIAGTSVLPPAKAARSPSRKAPGSPGSASEPPGRGEVDAGQRGVAHRHQPLAVQPVDQAGDAVAGRGRVEAEIEPAGEALRSGRQPQDGGEVGIDQIGMARPARRLRVAPVDPAVQAEPAAGHAGREPVEIEPALVEPRMQLRLVQRPAGERDRGRVEVEIAVDPGQAAEVEGPRRPLARGAAGRASPASSRSSGRAVVRSDTARRGRAPPASSSTVLPSDTGPTVPCSLSRRSRPRAQSASA